MLPTSEEYREAYNSGYDKGFKDGEGKAKRENQLPSVWEMFSNAQGIEEFDNNIIGVCVNETTYFTGSYSFGKPAWETKKTPSMVFIKNIWGIKFDKKTINRPEGV